MPKYELAVCPNNIFGSGYDQIIGKEFLATILFGGI